MHEVKESLSQCLMKAWKMGWPEYCEDPADDNKAIMQLCSKVSKEVKADISNDEGLKRISAGITNIAQFCRNNVPWSFKNIFWANLCFSTLYNHMKSKARMKAIRSGNYNYKK